MPRPGDEVKEAVAAAAMRTCWPRPKRETLYAAKRGGRNRVCAAVLNPAPPQ